MLFAVLFEDNENQLDQRQQHMSAHLNFLDQHAAEILAAGPLTEASDGVAAGGLWLVQADSLPTVEALVREDPFWSTGLRKSHRVLAWRQVFSEGQRRV